MPLLVNMLSERHFYEHLTLFPAALTIKSRSDVY